MFIAVAQLLSNEPEVGILMYRPAANFKQYAI